jgi:tRNA1Val (adenine37-N6)-methyltransferase
MKVGTDAVLLGIWTPLESVSTALDIGTGCGIIPLLLAARCPQVQVDAVELDVASAAEASGNFLQSPYADRLWVYPSDIKRFIPADRKKYDLIISNPPFFINDHRPQHAGRKMARHTDTLSYHQLVMAVKRLLKPEGVFSVVLPYRESKIFLSMAARAELYPRRRMLIFPKPCKEPNRINLLLSRYHKNPETEKFIIRNEKGFFTSQYLEMVKNYYLST